MATTKKRVVKKTSPVTGMSFGDAIEAMRKGKRVMRQPLPKIKSDLKPAPVIASTNYSLNDVDFLFIIPGDETRIRKRTEYKYNSIHDYTPSQEDMLARDWVVLK